MCTSLQAEWCHHGKGASWCWAPRRLETSVAGQGTAPGGLHHWNQPSFYPSTLSTLPLKASYGCFERNYLLSIQPAAWKKRNKSLNSCCSSPAFKPCFPLLGWSWIKTKSSESQNVFRTLWPKPSAQTLFSLEIPRLLSKSFSTTPAPRLTACGLFVKLHLLPVLYLSSKQRPSCQPVTLFWTAEKHLSRS